MAATAGAIRAGRAVVEAFLDDRKLVRDLKGLRLKLLAFGSQIAAIGSTISAVFTAALAPVLAITAAVAAAAAPFIAATKIFADAGSALSDMSARTGVGAEVLSELAYAAKQSGTDVDAVGRAFKGMAKTIDAARGGSKETLELLQRLGITLTDLQYMSPDEQFMAFGDAMSRVADPTRRAAIAMELFGKSGVDLLPLFENGARGVEKMRDEAKALGLVMSGTDAAAAEKLGDQLDTLWSQFKRVFEVVGAAMAPVLSDLADLLISATSSLIELINTNRDWLKYAASVTASVIALAGAWVYSTNVIQTVIGYLQKTFGELVKDLGDMFGAIKTALAAGQFQAAADVAMAALKLAFAVGTNAIESLWNKWLDNLWMSFTEKFKNVTNALHKLGLINAAEDVFPSSHHLAQKLDKTDVDKAREELKVAITAANLFKKPEEKPKRKLKKFDADDIDDAALAAQSKAASQSGTFSAEASRIIMGGKKPELEALNKIVRNTDMLRNPNGVAVYK